MACDDENLLMCVMCALVEQYIDDNIGDDIYDVRMNELVQAISTDPDSLECLRLIKEGWLKNNQIYGPGLARLCRSKRSID